LHYLHENYMSFSVYLFIVNDVSQPNRKTVNTTLLCMCVYLTRI